MASSYLWLPRSTFDILKLWHDVAFWFVEKLPYIGILSKLCGCLFNRSLWVFVYTSDLIFYNLTFLSVNDFLSLSINSFRTCSDGRLPKSSFNFQLVNNRSPMSANLLKDLEITLDWKAINSVQHNAFKTGVQYYKSSLSISTLTSIGTWQHYLSLQTK